ncbi:hypothetical protein [Arsenophonus endosymbiont of Aleurodicus floccissimus]|nr:hypothetical protein [Arsenophonus endosymbiont of Aleurodicus floccissimus]
MVQNTRPKAAQNLVPANNVRKYLRHKDVPAQEIPQLVKAPQ